MKKLSKTFAAISALALILSAGMFVSCSDSDDSDNTTQAPVDESQNQAGEATGDKGGSGNQGVTGTATIAYDGSAETNAPASSGTEGFFSDVQASVAGGFVSEKFGGLKDGYPKWESATYTGDDGTKNGTTSSGILVCGSTDDSSKPALTKGEAVAYVDYKFTLAAEASVSVAVSAFNTQSANLGGQIVILDSSSSEVVKGDVGEGSKSAMSATLAATKLAAGTYTLRFNWAAIKDLEASKGVKNHKGGISSFTITATN
ncbi:MAG: hypothetical protein IKO39_11490 [Treponema sp.]|nr:hypothetical protein [Treponema sp.]